MSVYVKSDATGNHLLRKLIDNIVNSVSRRQKIRKFFCVSRTTNRIVSSKSQLHHRFHLSSKNTMAYKR